MSVQAKTAKKEAVEILTEAIKGWEGGKKWYQGVGGRGPDGETCLVVGLSDAMRRLHYTWHHNAWALVCQTVFGLIPYSSPPKWNDSQERVYEDVQLLVEQAIADLKDG